MWINLTDRRRRIIEFIDSHIKESSYSPSLREIGAATGITSTSVVKYNVDRLVEAGILKNDGSIRGLSVLSVPELARLRVLSIIAPPKRRVKKRKRHKLRPAPAGCVYCGTTDAPLVREHFYPISRGGKDDISNIVPSCARCNLSKSDRDPVKWVIDSFGIDRLCEVIARLHS